MDSTCFWKAKIIYFSIVETSASFLVFPPHKPRALLPHLVFQQTWALWAEHSEQCHLTHTYRRNTRSSVECGDTAFAFLFCFYYGISQQLRHKCTQSSFITLLCGNCSLNSARCVSSWPQSMSSDFHSLTHAECGHSVDMHPSRSRSSWRKITTFISSVRQCACEGKEFGERKKHGECLSP